MRPYPFTRYIRPVITAERTWGCLQVVSKRVANAKSERFYRAGLGKKKEPGFWQVPPPLPPHLTLPLHPYAALHAHLCAHPAACRPSASSWQRTPWWLESYFSS
jgi:hypothetical protein